MRMRRDLNSHILLQNERAEVLSSFSTEKVMGMGIKGWREIYRLSFRIQFIKCIFPPFFLLRLDLY